MDDKYGSLVSCLGVWLLGPLVGCLVGRLVSWLVGVLAGWRAGWLADFGSMVWGIHLAGKTGIERRLYVLSRNPTNIGPERL